MSFTISVAEVFSKTPAGRLYSDGPFSGERFRNEVLVPALRQHDEIIVDLRGVFGFGSSFLEEAFGGLVRKAHFPKETIRGKMKVKSSLKTYENKVWEYIGAAKPE